MKELIEIQASLKAPKNQRNSFGNYNYRSAEDILEAVKPILKNHKCTLTITDQIELIGDRFYVKATAKLKNEKGEIEEVSAYAREELQKKGYDSSQITGSTSSYARKYALNGLFCIDDTKDADATNTHGKEEQPAQPATKPQSKPATKTSKVTSDIPDMGAMVLDIMSSADLNEITAKWNLYKKYDENKEITNAIVKRRKELGV